MGDEIMDNEIMDNERKNEINIKKIVVSFDPPPKKEKKDKTVKTQKEKQKRQITTTNKWNFTPEELSFPYQWSLLQNIKTNDEKKRENREHCDFIIRQINQKIYGYNELKKTIKNLYLLNDDIITFDFGEPKSFTWLEIKDKYISDLL
jgi:hypothetical protein